MAFNDQKKGKLVGVTFLAEATQENCKIPVVEAAGRDLAPFRSRHRKPNTKTIITPPRTSPATSPVEAELTTAKTTWKEGIAGGRNGRTCRIVRGEDLLGGDGSDGRESTGGGEGSVLFELVEKKKRLLGPPLVAGGGEVGVVTAAGGGDEKIKGRR
ncbi:hypothetical protein HPP92_004921 [Vanilla planifolia]|uniref:Uncharacterized protein n=1 Tax=Vanilla planifolia TaxID=51239 RepID=A0A835VCQ5_VANPL|nr:hypothetical protein HPP92_004921 [Vanilla planifolia]